MIIFEEIKKSKEINECYKEREFKKNYNNPFKKNAKNYLNK